MRNRIVVRGLLWVLFSVASFMSVPAFAQDAVAAVNPEPAVDPRGREVFVISSAPKGTQLAESQLWGPVAELLSRKTGKQFVYEYGENWLAYQKRMLEDRYDLNFDGPHFVGWRLVAADHSVVAKLAEKHVFVIVVRDDEVRIKKPTDLAGRGICAHAPPNLGTLVLLSQFTNPARQPRIVETKGWDGAFYGMMDGKCLATVLPDKNLAKFEKESGKKAKIIYTHPVLPNQALTAGPRINETLRGRIEAALSSPEGIEIMNRVAAEYGSKEFTTATRAEYAPVADLLREERGFGDALKAPAGGKRVASGSELEASLPATISGPAVKVKFQPVR